MFVTENKKPNALITAYTYSSQSIAYVHGSKANLTYVDGHCGSEKIGFYMPKNGGNSVPASYKTEQLWVANPTN